MFNLLHKNEFYYNEAEREWRLVIFNQYVQPLITLLVRGCGKKSATCLIYRKVGPRIVEF